MGSPDLIVVGAGAAGLLAAGTAASEGVGVLLLEKMPKPGCKLAITGKGRCNLTNVEPRGAFELHFGAAGEWLKPAFDVFFCDSLMRFLESEGLALVTERGGRVFPADRRADDVVKVLAAWAKRQGVQTVLRRSVRRLCLDQNRVCGVETEAGETRCQTVVMATGGASYPGTGSTGDGYRMAAEAGHVIVTPRPALVPLVCSPRPSSEMAGLALKNVSVTLLVDGHEVGRDFGELGFTAFGVNGPVVLTLSGVAVDALEAGRNVRLRVDLKPALSDQKLHARLERDLAARATEQIRSILRGLLPKPLIGLCLAEADVRGIIPGARLKSDGRERLVKWLKGMELTISGHRGMTEAIVTAGGVALDGVCPETMESRHVKGLFFAGEILDMHADTGGYNLQAAFSTGVLAGRCARRQCAGRKRLSEKSQGAV